ncbi:CRP-like cAMP-binding protein [Flavobacterium endophyticum]|uniref:CRP-like cAMP-binding protein n=1 Tax=Flavobacterium endophyticum TaxID=1540163 RepID=A0A495LZE1_9FLAO|nr:Crp/Fnr family transcriptional regulator [Flavobacterium endophyticum]RKS19127.1 CRP-like cAMP-binding protein [Flavobacterium endophyticum]
MLEKLKEAVDSVLRFTVEEWEAYTHRIEIKHFKKGDVLCDVGQVENYIYFLNSGATRNFFIKDGKELTVDFRLEGTFVAAYYSFLSRKPSPIRIEAITDIEACCIPHSSLYLFYKKHKNGEKLGRLMAEIQYMKRLEREIEILSMTAEERYALLLKQNPALVSAISVKHLSSYLGIHPESLSRIRKQVAAKLT